MENRIMLQHDPNSKGYFDILTYNENNEIIGVEGYQCLFNYRIIIPDSIQLVSSRYNIVRTFKLTSIYINNWDSPLVDADYGQDLAFLSSGFSQAGGSALTTFSPFEPHKSYKEGDVIIEDNMLFVAIHDFVATAGMDINDWIELTLRPETIYDAINERVEATSWENKIYGTDDSGNYKLYDYLKEIAGTTILGYFEKNKSYKKDTLIFFEGDLYRAKSDFVSGNEFVEGDWYYASVSNEDIDYKVNRNPASNIIYGTDAAGDDTSIPRDALENTSNKTTDIRDADHADDTKYPTELAVRKHLNGGWDYLNANKVEITQEVDRIYGTDFEGNQTTYRKNELGNVDTVNGISPDESKNVQTNYVYNTEEEFENDKNNIPVGATVIKLYEYPDNSAGFMVVPDYSNIESINRINTSTETWTADRTGFVFVGSNVNAQEGFSHGFFRINAKKVYEFYFESQYGGGGTVLPLQKGDTVAIHIRHETYSPEPMRSCYFIPPKFIEKEFPVVVEKNGSYSQDEVKTAETWIDGKPIYKRTVAPNIMILANQNTNISASWVSDIEFLIDNQIVAVDSEGSHRTTGKALEIIVDIKNSAITISSSSSRNMTLYGVTLFYTKIAD